MLKNIISRILYRDIPNPCLTGGFSCLYFHIIKTTCIIPNSNLDGLFEER